MKRLRLLLLLSVLFAIPQLQARDFFFGFTSQGSNAWFTPMQLPVNWLNNFIGGGQVGMQYEWLHVSSNDGRDVRVRNGEFFGIRARDMFNNFGVGLRVAYQPQWSWFGMWATGGWKYRQFRLDIDPNSDQLQKYKSNAWYAGVGIRLTPFLGWLEDHGCSPFFDFGTQYNDVFKVKAPYDNDKAQFGKGMSTSFGIGLRFADYREETSTNIALTFTLPQYNFLDRGYTLADGTKPYEHIKSRAYSICLTFQREF